MLISLFETPFNHFVFLSRTDDKTKLRLYESLQLSYRFYLYMHMQSVQIFQDILPPSSKLKNLPEQLFVQREVERTLA